MNTAEIEIITENTAAELVGVSPRTLERFAEAGYLITQRHMSGSRAYLKDEVTKLFGITNGAYPSAPSESHSGPSCGMTENAFTEEKPLTSSSPPTETKEILVKAQGKVMELLERENSELRSQIDWLKKRLEWLEEKSERDQILLMSETQTIQKLVNLQSARKSFGQVFLEWIGITPEPERKLLAGTGQVVAMPERRKDSTAVNS